MRDAVNGVRERGIPIVAISGIIGGKAIKGPADRMLASLGRESSAIGVAREYVDIAGAFVLDTIDGATSPSIEALGMRTLVTDTIMSDDAARARLAREVLEFSTQNGFG
jgi:LPPG:FO 2-phospho-L-lactate transferase